MRRVDSLEKALMLGGIGGRRRRDDRGWDGWMASLTRWTWVWINSGSWWWTGRPGVLWFMGSQRVGHDWATDLVSSDLMSVSISQSIPPSLPTWCSLICSLHLCLYFCFANKIIYTIFMLRNESSKTLIFGSKKLHLNFGFFSPLHSKQLVEIYKLFWL